MLIFFNFFFTTFRFLFFMSERCPEERTLSQTHKLSITGTTHQRQERQRESMQPCLSSVCLLPLSLLHLLLFFLSHLALFNPLRAPPAHCGRVVIASCVLPLIMKSAEMKHPFVYSSQLFKPEWKLCLLFLKKQYYIQFQ